MNIMKEEMNNVLRTISDPEFLKMTFDQIEDQFEKDMITFGLGFFVTIDVTDGELTLKFLDYFFKQLQGLEQENRSKFMFYLQIKFGFKFLTNYVLTDYEVNTPAKIILHKQLPKDLKVIINKKTCQILYLKETPLGVLYGVNKRAFEFKFLDYATDFKKVIEVIEYHYNVKGVRYNIFEDSEFIRMNVVFDDDINTKIVKYHRINEKNTCECKLVLKIPCEHKELPHIFKSGLSIMGKILNESWGEYDSKDNTVYMSTIISASNWKILDENVANEIKFITKRLNEVKEANLSKHLKMRFVPEVNILVI